MLPEKIIASQINEDKKEEEKKDGQAIKGYW